MALAFQLEEFHPTTLGHTQAPIEPAMETPVIHAEDLEKARLAGYEAGYQAGWDDSIKSESDDQNRIGAEFARNLRDLGFTFHEARSHIMQGLEPVLSEMFDKVLPALVSETIGQSVLEELVEIATDAADIPIEIVVPPSARAAIEPLLRSATAIPFTLVEEPSLADSQIFLRSGKAEKHLDLSAVIQHFKEATQKLYDLNEKAFQNG